MTELLERLEVADGPCRELDCRIWCKEGGFTEVALKVVPNFNDWAAPAYTSSIDAALTLVPEGFDWEFGHTNDGLTIHAKVGSHEMHFAPTPALAICIAALKAREAGE